MQINIGDQPLEMPVLLAPMAGITDVPFRNVVQKYGAGLVVSEMVASAEMVHAGKSARRKAISGSGTGRTSVQLAGRDAYWMAEAARMCADQGARIIDINFGCPAKKVTSGWSGAALMRNVDHAITLVDAVVSAVDVPVTLKMRLGWDEEQINAPEVAARAERAGVCMITVHGRTRCQFYKGSADWDAIAAVTQAVDIPVIANGDIGCTTSAREALSRSGAAGVMVGRAARGRPWLPAQIGAALTGADARPDPGLAERREIIISHYEEMLRFHGVDLGVRIARKQIGWYLDNIAGAANLRRRVLTMTCPQAVIEELHRGIAECDPVMAVDAA